MSEEEFDKLQELNRHHDNMLKLICEMISHEELLYDKRQIDYAT